MTDENDITKAYEELYKKYYELQAAEEELATSYEELQSAEEELNVQNEELRSIKISLQQSEELLKESQRVAGLGHYVFSIPNSRWDSSEMLNEIFGITQAYTRDINGWLKIIHPACQKEMLDYLATHVIANKNQFDKEYKIIRVSDQQERWVHGRGNLKFDSNGDAIELFGVIQDITERKQIEKALDESNERLKFAMEGTNDGLWDVQLKTGCLYISPRGCEILGYGIDELEDVVKVWSDLVHPEDLPLTNERLQAHLNGETSIFEVEQRLRMKSGAWKWIHTRGKVVARDQDGTPLRITGTHTDISDRKSAQLANSHSLYLLNYIIEHNNSGVAVFDNHMRYIYVSQRFLDEYKIKADSVIGKSHYEIFPEIPESWREIHKRALQGEILSEDEDPFYRLDGSIDWTRWECRPWFQADGTIGGIIIYTQVINQRKEHERLINEKNVELNAFFDNAIDLLCIADTSGHFVRLNKEWESVLGYSLEDLEGKNFTEFVHPDDLESSLSTIDQLTNQLKILNFTNRYRCKDGTYKWIEWRSTPNGSRIYAAARDITERIEKRAELIAAKERAEEGEETYRMLFDSINDAVFISEMNGDGNSRKFIKVNDVACQRLGYSQQELLGKSPLDLVSESSKNDFQLQIQEVLKNKQGIIETVHLTKSGEPIPVEISIRVKQFKGKTLFHSISRDITERKRAEIQLKEKTDEIEAQNEEYRQINEELYLAKERAEESDRLKTAFLQNMSHEIRTPMNAIMGFSQLLVQYYDNKPKIEHFSRIINQRCNDLLEIINDLLDIAKIESGQLHVEILPCNIQKLFSELNPFFEEYLIRQKKQHISLNINPGSESGISALTDSCKLKQILINLIGNAIKFTTQGSIEVGYYVDSAEYITFYVKDTGIGIPKAKQQFIFNRFAQVDHGPQRLYGGTGLGLTIVKGLLNFLGGKIWLESEPEVGSTFFFTIPLAAADSSINEVPLSTNNSFKTDHHNRTILIVEDDLFNSEFIKEVLSDCGCTLLFAHTGSDAIQIAVDQSPDLVLMDIRLPDMSGYEAISKIKEHKPGLKFIAQTAYAQDEDRQMAINSGCVDFISKPLKSTLLLAMVSTQL